MSTDPLADWTLERDVVRGMPYAHTLRLPEHLTHYWLTDAEADQFERAKAITAAWAERGDEARHGRAPEWDTDRTFLLRWLNSEAINGDDLADVLARYLAVFAPERLALPADDLPEGVHRIDADTLVARGIDIPEGWEFYGPAESLEASEDESRPWWDWRDREADVRTGHVVYRVRRRPTPPPPAVETIDTRLAKGRTLPDGRVIAATGDNGNLGPWWSFRDRTPVTYAATVEVLRQDGES